MKLLRLRREECKDPEQLHRICITILNRPYFKCIQDTQLDFAGMSVTMARMLLRLRMQALSDSSGHTDDVQNGVRTDFVGGSRIEHEDLWYPTNK